MIKYVKNDFFIYCKEARIENNRSFYGSFSLGPFDAGQSITIANALRRTLLSELKGLAITSAEIEGAFHEYSTLPGVRDSILDILLNLKDIVLKSTHYGNKKNATSLYPFSSQRSTPKKGGLEGTKRGMVSLLHTGKEGKREKGVLPLIENSKKDVATFKSEEMGYLKTRGPGVVTASELKLPPGIQCVDPDQYIATLTEEGILNMKFSINEGKNYVIQSAAAQTPSLIRPILAVQSDSPSHSIPLLSLQQSSTPGSSRVVAKGKVEEEIIKNKGGVSSAHHVGKKREAKATKFHLNKQKKNAIYLNEFNYVEFLKTEKPLGLRRLWLKRIKAIKCKLTRGGIGRDKKMGCFAMPKILAAPAALAIDAVFMPVNKVNYIIEINEQSVISSPGTSPGKDKNFQSREFQKAYTASPPFLNKYTMNTSGDNPPLQEAPLRGVASRKELIEKVQDTRPKGGLAGEAFPTKEQNSNNVLSIKKTDEGAINQKNLLFKTINSHLLGWGFLNLYTQPLLHLSLAPLVKRKRFFSLAFLTHQNFAGYTSLFSASSTLLNHSLRGGDKSLLRKELSSYQKMTKRKGKESILGSFIKTRENTINPPLHFFSSLAQNKNQNMRLSDYQTKTSLKNNIILEIWTNGSIHPRQALYEACKNLLSLFSKLEKAKFIRSIFKSKKSSLYPFGPFAKGQSRTLPCANLSSTLGGIALNLKKSPRVQKAVLAASYPLPSEAPQMKHIETGQRSLSYPLKRSWEKRKRPLPFFFCSLPLYGRSKKKGGGSLMGHSILNKNGPFLYEVCFKKSRKLHNLKLFKGNRAIVLGGFALQKNLAKLNHIRGCYKNGFYFAKSNH